MTTAALLEALHDPTIYPEPTTTVEVRETHISLVFLTDQYAYKVKKPLNLGFLDYSTLAQRHTYGQQGCMAALARDLGADCYILACQTPEAIIRERLEQRVQTPGSISDRRWELFAQFQRDYEPVYETESAKSIRLDTTQSGSLGVQQALAAIQEGRA